MLTLVVVRSSPDHAPSTAVAASLSMNSHRFDGIGVAISAPYCRIRDGSPIARLTSRSWRMSLNRARDANNLRRWKANGIERRAAGRHIDGQQERLGVYERRCGDTGRTSSNT